MNGIAKADRVNIKRTLSFQTRQHQMLSYTLLLLAAYLDNLSELLGSLVGLQTFVPLGTRVYPQFREEDSATGR
jgi:hypothetical protein